MKQLSREDFEKLPSYTAKTFIAGLEKLQI